MKDDILIFESTDTKMTFLKGDDVNVFIKIVDKMNDFERNFLICAHLYSKRNFEAKNSISFLLLDLHSRSFKKDIDYLDKHLSQKFELDDLYCVAKDLKSANIMAAILI
jgi:hypothetical protein